ncbi:MAG: amidohydrolase family protein [Treponema sp.]|jgi:predicted amidohydrolase|nr:amidohydrolase family protein [Treponema sp.]
MNDFLIKNGRVVDTALGINDVIDIAIKNDIIAEVGKNLPVNNAVRVIDADGCYITPGLVDYHAHINYGSSDICFRAEIGCFPSGVTTCVDGGSAGVSSYENFYNTIVCSSQVNIKGYLNISSVGETAHSCPEELNPALFEIDKILRFCKKYEGNIVGIKIRLGAPMVRNFGIEPLKVAQKVAKDAGIPLTVHMIDCPVPVKDVLAVLSAGDIYCHVFHNTGKGTILDQNGKLLPELFEARKRGVLFDVSHGRGAGSFTVAKAALEQGFKPDLITSDLSRYSLYRSPAYTVNYIMSEFLHLGFTFEELIKMYTETSAKLIYGKCDGFIKPGYLADLAIFRLVDKPVTFVDYKGEKLNGNKIIKCEMTFKDGEPVFCQVDSQAGPYPVL